MKKITKSLLAALLFAFVIAAISGLGSVKASASTFSADLDGDGTDETIEYEISDVDYSSTLSSLTINGKDALKAVQLNPPFTPSYIDISVIDTCTKDGVKELLVIQQVDSWRVNYLLRYKSGKISKYCEVEADEILSQKKKNTIATKDYVFVNGIGNIFVTLTGKVKSGKVKYTTDAPIAPNKDNETLTFKTTQKITLYSDEYVSEKIGTLKKGAKIKIVKIMRDGEGNFTRICVKSGKSKGWIDTYGVEDFIIKNPPLWN